jgi:hypothetical protein
VYLYYVHATIKDRELIKKKKDLLFCESPYVTNRNESGVTSGGHVITMLSQ